MNSSSIPTELPDNGVSSRDFFLGSAAVFSLGAAYGVRRVVKREQASADVQLGRPSYIYAFKALGLGTVLCLSLFTAAGVAFSLSTGVRTLPEFAHWARGIGSKVPSGPQPLPGEVDELEVDLEQALKELNESVDARVESISSFSFFNRKKSTTTDSKESK